MDDGVRSAWNWLLVDAWGISLLTAAACALVVGAMMAAGYLFLASLAVLADAVRRVSGSSAARSEPDPAGEWRRSASG